MIVYTRNAKKKTTSRLLELLWQFNKVAGYKINIKSWDPYVYTSLKGLVRKDFKSYHIYYNRYPLHVCLTTHTSEASGGMFKICNTIPESKMTELGSTTTQTESGIQHWIYETPSQSIAGMEML